MGYNRLINGVYWGYNPFTNQLLTSWDIQVRYPPPKLRPYDQGLLTSGFPELRPAIRALFFGVGSFGGVPLDCHDVACEDSSCCKDGTRWAGPCPPNG